MKHDNDVFEKTLGWTFYMVSKGYCKYSCVLLPVSNVSVLNLLKVALTPGKVHWQIFPLDLHINTFFFVSLG